MNFLNKMELTETEKEIVNKEKKLRNISNVADNQGTRGKLKKVSKVRKTFFCNDCNKEVPEGSPCYNQSDYTGEDFFPAKLKLCIDCGQIQIKNGVEVK